MKKLLIVAFSICCQIFERHELSAAAVKTPSVPFEEIEPEPMDHASHEAERDVEQMPENSDYRRENHADYTEIKQLTSQIVECLGEQRTRKTEREKSDVAEYVAEELNSVVKPEEGSVNHFERVESLCLDRVENDQNSGKNFKREKSVRAYCSRVSRIENRASAFVEGIPEEERPDAADP